jgi:YHS domain-containing protein
MHLANRRLIGLFVAVLSCGLIWAADAPATGRRADQAALKPYGSLVGGWRGVGQLDRGKAKGSWSEQAEWAWKLTADSAALEGTIAKGKHLKSLVLHPGPEPQTYRADAVLADDTKRTFAGKGGDEKPLVLMADPPGGPGVQRITVTPLHGTRLVVLLEGREDKVFYRLGEVGYTRQGVAFAVGESGPVCIVTEGRGTMSVNYKGKSYFVCCTGCRDLFNENPEAILAEAAERQKAKDKK